MHDVTVYDNKVKTPSKYFFQEFYKWALESIAAIALGIAKLISETKDLKEYRNNKKLAIFSSLPVFLFQKCNTLRNHENLYK